MKSSFLLIVCAIMSFAGMAQVVEFDVTPVPDKSFPIVHPYIFNDGSFELYCDDVVYLYDDKGNLKEDPYNYRDDVYSTWATNREKTLIDPKTDMRYCFEPLISKRVQLGLADYKYGVIYIDKMGTGGKQRQIISFQDPDMGSDKQRERELALAKVEQDYTDALHIPYCFFAENGDPVFVLLRKGVSKSDPAAKEDKKKYSFFTTCYRLNKLDNTVKVSKHLVNKVPIGKTGDSDARQSVLGYLDGKVYLAIDYQENIGAKAGTVEIWSFSLETGEEEKEHVFTYDFDDASVSLDRKSLQVVQDSQFSELIYHIASISPGKESTKHKVLRIGAGSQFELIEFKSEGANGTYKSYYHSVVDNEENEHFFNAGIATGESIQKRSCTTHILDYNTEVHTRTQARTYLVYPQDATVLFDKRMAKLLESLSTPVFVNADEICRLCPKYRLYTYRMTANQIARSLAIEFMTPDNCMDCKIERMRVRYVSEVVEE